MNGSDPTGLYLYRRPRFWQDGAEARALDMIDATNPYPGMFSGMGHPEIGPGGGGASAQVQPAVPQQSCGAAWGEFAVTLVGDALFVTGIYAPARAAWIGGRLVFNGVIEAGVASITRMLGGAIRGGIASTVKAGAAPSLYSGATLLGEASAAAAPSLQSRGLISLMRLEKSGRNGWDLVPIIGLGRSIGRLLDACP